MSNFLKAVLAIATIIRIAYMDVVEALDQIAKNTKTAKLS